MPLGREWGPSHHLKWCVKSPVFVFEMARPTPSRASRRSALRSRHGACGRPEHRCAFRACTPTHATSRAVAARSSCRAVTCTVAASVEEPQRAMRSGLIRHGSRSLHSSQRVGCVATQLGVDAGSVQAWPRARHRSIWSLADSAVQCPSGTMVCLPSRSMRCRMAGVVLGWRALMICQPLAASGPSS